ncbi:MAG: ABC transporter permease [Halobacteriales archaeon]|nr:ABC transporter permease [Halobacteriales archaeon]
MSERQPDGGFESATEPAREVANTPLIAHHRRDQLLKYGLYGFAGLMLLFLWIPLFVMTFLSFATNPATIVPFEGFTLVHYAETFADDALIASLLNSFQVATISASIATVLGVLASFGLVRYEFPFKETFRTFGILPLIIPGVILGLSMLIFFRSLVGIGTGFLTVVLTHSVYGFPFVMLPVTARLYGFDESLEESARDLGADTIEAFVDVTLPIIAPAIGAGFLFAWIRSFEDFIRAFFVRGTTRIVTTQMYGMIKYGLGNRMNAISTVIIVVIAVTLALAMNYGNVSQFVGNSETESDEE